MLRICFKQLHALQDDIMEMKILKRYAGVLYYCLVTFPLESGCHHKHKLHVFQRFDCHGFLTVMSFNFRKFNVITLEKLGVCNMAGVRKSLAIFAVFLVYCPIPTSSTPSSELLSKKYAQIAQHFGFPSPKLPNISSVKVSKQCIETVEKLNTSELVLCKYFLVHFFLHAYDFVKTITVDLTHARSASAASFSH